MPSHDSVGFPMFLLPLPFLGDQIPQILDHTDRMLEGSKVPGIVALCSTHRHIDSHMTTESR